MTTLREAAQQALEALENAEDQLAKPYSTDASKAVVALRAALAQQAEPVGFWVLYPGNATQTRFAMYLRPTDEQIKNTEALLGWGWEDA